MFDIPVVLFIFKRPKAVAVLEQISKIKPKKLYIMADGPRSDAEKEAVEECRRQVENAITWECEVIKNYSSINRGVYENIGKGAIWVFEREEKAIFLEDDNYPELTFFEFCREMLLKYENEEKVLWICGTNYLETYDSKHKESYLFTQHMLPCGWASWSKKFIKYYDGEMCNFNSHNLNTIEKRYIYRGLFEDMRDAWTAEYTRLKNGDKPNSWDYQMDYSLKYYNLFGICPTRNQIKNIGVDEYSIHGGTSKKMTMTNRFCDKEIFPIEFPLNHPTNICVHKEFERKMAKIIISPLRYRIKVKFIKLIRKLFKIPYGISTKQYFVTNNKNEK